jgi:hypothetical protein
MLKAEELSVVQVQVLLLLVLLSVVQQLVLVVQLENN